MKRRTIQLKDAEKEIVLDSFSTAFDKEFNEEILNINVDLSQDGFLALEDFYKEFNIEVEGKEIVLKDKLFKGIITAKELEELENIALVKYSGIKLEELTAFYLYSNREERERLVKCISQQLV